MGDTTGISWTDKTLNPWIGCERVPGGECDNCYADRGSRRLAAQHHLKLWDEGSTRYITKNWRKSVLAWERQAVREGTTFRVFCASFSDLFEDQPAVAPTRRELLHEIVPATPHLTYQFLTKRPENVRMFAPASWFGGGWPLNVWLGTTVGARVSLGRLDVLRSLPVPTLFVSFEPLIEYLGIRNDELEGISWAILGGESGPKARPCAIEWIEQIMHQCRAAGAAVFVKQLGARPTARLQGHDIPLVFKDKHGGDMAEWQSIGLHNLCVREFPAARVGVTPSKV